MKLNLATYHLALHEYLATSGNLDKIINFDFIENGFKNNFDMEQKEIDIFISVFMKALQSQTVKKSFLSHKYQKMYRSKELRKKFEQVNYFNTLEDIVDEVPTFDELAEFHVKFFTDIGCSEEVEKIFEPAAEIIYKHKIIEFMNSEKMDLTLSDSSIVGELYSFVNLEKLPEVNEIKFNIHKRDSESIKFKKFNKQFELDIEDLNYSGIEQFLMRSTNLSDNHLLEVLHALFEYHKNDVINYPNQNSCESMFDLWYLTRYDLRFFLFYIESRDRKAEFYKTLYDRDYEFADVTIEKMMEYIEFVNLTFLNHFLIHKNYEMFWSGYLDYLIQLDLSGQLLEKNEMLKTITDSTISSSEDNNSIQQAKKIKLKDHKYIYATRLQYKAEIEIKSFPELCREAAKRYVDIQGKDFTGNNLESCFKSMKSQYELESLRKRAGILIF